MALFKKCTICGSKKMALGSNALVHDAIKFGLSIPSVITTSNQEVDPIKLKNSGQDPWGMVKDICTDCMDKIEITCPICSTKWYPKTKIKFSKEYVESVNACPNCVREKQKLEMDQAVNDIAQANRENWLKKERDEFENKSTYSMKKFASWARESGVYSWSMSLFGEEKNHQYFTYLVIEEEIIDKGSGWDLESDIPIKDGNNNLIVELLLLSAEKTGSGRFNKKIFKYLITTDDISKLTLSRCDFYFHLLKYNAETETKLEVKYYDLLPRLKLILEATSKCNEMPTEDLAKRYWIQSSTNDSGEIHVSKITLAKKLEKYGYQQLELMFSYEKKKKIGFLFFAVTSFELIVPDIDDLREVLVKVMDDVLNLKPEDVQVAENVIHFKFQSTPKTIDQVLSSDSNNISIRVNLSSDKKLDYRFDVTDRMRKKIKAFEEYFESIK